ncbi:hypothetical protein H6F89_21325 [Cyanobacteria bacterium FACHB-63]|nr:hypothetical protein [Cyanobacteria bacterium FACHB-63]
MPPILNDSLKAELEQTRNRLLNEQDEIVQAISKQAEAEIDRLLGYINSLLGDSQPSAPQGSQTAPASQPKASVSKPKVASTKSAQSPFDATTLKAKFKGVKPMDAIVQVLADEKHPLSIDDLINQLYDGFDQADISKARRSVAITTKHAERRGLVRKIQDNPPQFQAP